MNLNSSLIKAVVAYTLAPWEHALPTLRLAGPLGAAGLQLIQGNRYEDIHPERVSHGDLVVIQRDFPRFSDTYAQILALSKAEDIPLILDLDDLLLELPEDHPDRQSGYYAGALFPLLRAILEADALTVATQPLQAYFQALNPNVWVLPNYLNDDLWGFREVPEPGSRNKPVVIGYMGGDSHQPDLEIVLPSLLKILDRYGQSIHLRFWGLQPPAVLAHRPNVEWVQMRIHDYAEFARFFQQQEADIFIAPLADTLFNRCKSPIKFLEYSALGIPGVFSRLSPYGTVVTHGENGLLAANPEEWTASLGQLIEDPALRYRIGLNAQKTVREEWLLSQHAHEWRATYQQILDGGKRDRKIEGTEMAFVFRLAEQVGEGYRSLEARLREKEQEAQALQSELAAIQQSKSWAILQKLQAVRRLLAPEGNPREGALRSMIGKLK